MKLILQTLICISILILKKHILISRLNILLNGKLMIQKINENELKTILQDEKYEPLIKELKNYTVENYMKQIIILFYIIFYANLYGQ